MGSSLSFGTDVDDTETVHSLKLGAVQASCKPVVISVDFGTAFSGIALTFKATPGCATFGAPTTRTTNDMKAPTVLLELPGNEWKFGYEAENKYNELLMKTTDGKLPAGNLFRRFKMKLVGKEDGFESLTATSLTGNSHSLMNLITKSLEFLKAYALSILHNDFGGEVDPEKDVQWVLTVPAIWNDFAKAFMRKAAFKAGMTDDEQSDNLMLVLEPEAAALAVHVGEAEHRLLSTGNRFLLLDCGGGTIDLLTLAVQKAQPLTFRAVTAPGGGAWGGENVNSEFRAFLKELLGPELFDESGMLLEFYTIYSEFDKLKVIFDPAKDPGNLRLVDVLEKKKQLVDLAAAWNAKHPEKPILNTGTQHYGFLAMSKELMLSFFEPSLAAIVAETWRELSTCPGIRHIVPVGGFATSKVLQARLISEFHNKSGVRVILCDTNPKPQGACMLGAVLFGLYDLKPLDQEVMNHLFRKQVQKLQEHLRAKETDLYQVTLEAHSQAEMVTTLRSAIQSLESELSTTAQRSTEEARQALGFASDLLHQLDTEKQALQLEKVRWRRLARLRRCVRSIWERLTQVTQQAVNAATVCGFESFACDAIFALENLGHNETVAADVFVAQVMLPLYAGCKGYVNQRIRAGATGAVINVTARLADQINALSNGDIEALIAATDRDHAGVLGAVHARMLEDARAGLISDSDSDLRVPQLVRALLLLFAQAAANTLQSGTSGTSAEAGRAKALVRVMELETHDYHTDRFVPPNPPGR